MKCFRNASILQRVAVASTAVLVASAGWAAVEWKDTESGSPIEAALYRWMPMPVSKVLGLRPPRETVSQLSELIKKQPTAELYSLRAMNEEAALDFKAAEADWKKYSETASERGQGQLALADFYHRRLRPEDEIAALGVVARAPAAANEKLTPLEQQRSWLAFERIFKVIRENALPSEVSEQNYRAWIVRYPASDAVYTRHLNFLLEKKSFNEAEKLVAQHQQAFPDDTVFPVKARALIAYKKGSVEQALAVYEAQFQPLWPPELIESYFDLLKETRSLRRFVDNARAALERNPDDLNAAARIYYYYQRQGRPEAAQQAITSYRLSKERRKARWASQELYTLARLAEAANSWPEAARYYYALYNTNDRQDAQELALSGLASVLLTAPEQSICFGAGDLSMYRDIATMDSGPGFLNGILSVVLNSTDPAGRYSEEEQRAAWYFHRAKAAELVRLFDSRFPNSARRAELDARVIEMFANYGESEAVIRDARAFLASFPNAEGERERVALLLADAYARTNRQQEEFALYDSLLAELARKAEGIPLGAKAEDAIAQETPAAAQESEEGAETSEGEGETSANAQSRALSIQSRQSPPPRAANSNTYSKVLERYLSRLVSTDQIPQALAVLRREIDRNPTDPGLYERLAQFLEQNQLGAQQEQVYQRALQQFSDRSWYHKLARFYLREKRQADFLRLSEQVIKIFSGTELESYFSNVSYGEHYKRLNEYAHTRFPHDLTFVRNLLGAYRAGTPQWEQLLRQHWWEAEDLRSRFFEFLSRTGRLEQELAALNQSDPAAQQGRWQQLASGNPVAARFIGEAAFWGSHYEQGTPLMGALAQQFPADGELGGRASAAYRSLAAFDPKNTELAIAIQENLYKADPGNRDTLALIGDTLADRELFNRSATYWERMAKVRPGEPQSWLDAATVYWDYYNFDRALRLLNQGRARLGDPALYSYEEGAIYENKREYPAAIAEYVKGALKQGVRNDGAQDGYAASPSQERLLQLARRPNLRQVVDEATAPLAAGAAPDVNAVKLRLAVLEAQGRTKDVESLLASLTARTSSLELLEWAEETARQKSLVAVQQSALERQVAVTADPLRRLELRLALVRFHESNRDTQSAQRVLEALYRENSKVLGVVRTATDFYWRNEQRQRAIDVLLRAADDAYPALSAQFRLEAARKANEAGSYEQARKVLNQLLAAEPYNEEYLAAEADSYARAGDDQGLKTFYLQNIYALRNASLRVEARNRQIATLRRGLIPALTRLKDYAGAVDQYIEIINRYPEDDALVTEAVLYAQKYGRQPQILDFYGTTARQSPRDYRWPMVLARIETQLEDYPAAINAYEQAINVRPDRVDLRTARADLFERLMRFDEAATDYQRLYELNYHDTRWMEKVALLRGRQGRVSETVAALQKALIENRPEKPENYFEVARRLESWGMLSQAKDFAEKGVSSSGRDLLAVPEHHAGAELYARIMTRLRQQEEAYQRLQSAVGNAGSFAASVGVVVEQVQKQGIASITDSQWRQRALQARTNAAENGMVAALRSMGSTVKQYFTPEEKTAFAASLQNRAANASEDEVAKVFLPAAEAAELPDLQAAWTEWLMLSQYSGRGQQYEAQLKKLQSGRMRFQELGQQLERYAQVQPVGLRTGALKAAAQAYRSGAAYDDELRVLSQIWKNGDSQRYFDLLLHRRPQQLAQLAYSAPDGFPDQAAQYAIEHGNENVAMQTVAARGRAMPPVWRSSYAALTGLYFGDRSANIKTTFLNALGDGTIAERIGKPVDRERQLAGNPWFYYGSRYGEWIGMAQAGDPEDFLPAILEQSPASASGYVTVAEFYAESGKLERAADDYNHALELAPTRADVHDRLAVVYWRQQKQTAAVAEWKRAIEALQANPKSGDFGSTLSDILNHVGSRHVLAKVRPQADSLLRDYLRQNGVYQADSILRAAFVASGDPQDGVRWLEEVASAAPDASGVLQFLVKAEWIPDPARDPLYRQLLTLLQQRVRGSEGLSRQYAEQDARSWQVRYAQYLVGLKQYDRAASVLESMPKQAPSADELQVRLQAANARGALQALLADYERAPESAPRPDLLREAAVSLQKAGEASAARTVLQYVYTQEISAHNLTAPNLLGLAEIRLQDGDKAGARELLRRVALVVGQPFENLDAAASLLARTGNHVEAAEFLSQLVAATPWDSGARVRLAQERIASGQDVASARAVLVAVASNGLSAYTERVQAAESLSGGNAPTLGSAELDLLARGSANADEADKPYFHAARLKVAKRTTTPEEGARLLRNAVSDAPELDDARIPLFQKLAAMGRDQLALSAINPMLRSGFLQVPMEFYGAYDEAPQYDGGEYVGYVEPAARQRYTAYEGERASVAAAVGKAYAHMEQYNAALRYLKLATTLETAKDKLAAIQKQIADVQATMRRNAENARRMPKIHSEVEQEQLVRPRLAASVRPPATQRRGQGGAQ